MHQKPTCVLRFAVFMGFNLSKPLVISRFCRKTLLNGLFEGLKAINSIHKSVFGA